MQITPETVLPEAVLPLVEPILPAIREALYIGIAHADDIQLHPDASYWCHSVRHCVIEELALDPATGWELIPNVSNTGIHLRHEGLLTLRVRRPVDGTTPPPGNSRASRQSWRQETLALTLDTDLGNVDSIPAALLILDWDVDGAGVLVLHLGMPLGAWERGEDPILAWRVPLPVEDMEEVAFEATDDTDIEIRLRTDEAESDEG